MPISCPDAEPARTGPEREATPGDVTRWLIEWGNGDGQALERLVPLVYAELRRLAAGYLSRRGPRPVLQPTALVNEAFLRLIDRSRVDWVNRAHFFGVAAKTMRGILVDQARRQAAAKRGGAAVTVTFDEAFERAGREKELDLLALDDALGGLATLDPELSRLVDLRFFGGLTIEETAVVLGVSTATVKRSWKTARTWLRREMSR